MGHRIVPFSHRDSGVFYIFSLSQGDGIEDTWFVLSSFAGAARFWECFREHWAQTRGLLHKARPRVPEKERREGERGRERERERVRAPRAQPAAPRASVGPQRSPFAQEKAYAWGGHAGWAARGGRARRARERGHGAPRGRASDAAVRGSEVRHVAKERGRCQRVRALGWPQAVCVARACARCRRHGGGVAVCHTCERVPLVRSMRHRYSVPPAECVLLCRGEFARALCGPCARATARREMRCACTLHARPDAVQRGAGCERGAAAVRT